MTPIRALLASFLLVLASLSATGCKTNPTTGRSQFLPISVEQEAQMGEQAAPEFLASYGGQLPDEHIVSYVRNLGHALAAEAEEIIQEKTGEPAPPRDWEFHVVDSAVINAFALPGGKVFISRALLARMEDEAQLAGVLGHEIGHVTGRHIADQMGKALGLQVALTAASAAAGLGTTAGTTGALMAELGVKAAGAGGSVYLLSYGRGQELEADALGIRYMTRLGYNPVAQLRVMEILRDASGGAGGVPEWLSTHPHPESRIEQVEEIVAEQYPDYDDPNKYRANQQQFQQNVLARLQQLPPPKHTQQSADAAGGDSTLQTSVAIGAMERGEAAAAADPQAQAAAKVVSPQPPVRWVRNGPYAGVVGGSHVNCVCHTPAALKLPGDGNATGVQP